MMSAGKRTPGPWILSDDQTCSCDVSFYAETPIHRNPRWIGRVYGPGPLAREWAERDANAAFIVEACNAHETLTAQRDAMAEALRGLFKECAMIHRYGGEIYNGKEADEAIKRAVSALALADGAK